MKSQNSMEIEIFLLFETCLIRRVALYDRKVALNFKKVPL